MALNKINSKILIMLQILYTNTKLVFWLLLKFIFLMQWFIFFLIKRKLSYFNLIFSFLHLFFSSTQFV